MIAQSKLEKAKHLELKVTIRLIKYSDERLREFKRLEDENVAHEASSSTVTPSPGR